MSNVKKFWYMFWSIYSRPKLSTQMPQLFVIKICSTIKVNSICGVGWDTKNLCHKFNSQGPALRVLGLRVASSKSQGPGCQGPMYQGSRVPGLRVPGPGPQVLILDYALHNINFSPHKVVQPLTKYYGVSKRRKKKRKRVCYANRKEARHILTQNMKRKQRI